MCQTRNRAVALLLTVLLALTAVSGAVTAQAEAVTMNGRTYRDGLGQGADLAGAKNALLAAMRNRDASVDLSRYGLGSDQLSDLYDQVFFENPSLFYLENGYSYNTRLSRSVPDALVVGRVEPNYYPELSPQLSARYEAAVQEALSVLRPGMTDFDKALALHDYLAAHCDYDDTLTHFSPYYALVDGTAVCQGYLLAYSDLLNRVGIPNRAAVSLSQNHGWNTVALGGVWYHVDVTWDRLGGAPENWVLHTNFLRTDRGIAATGTLHRDWIAPHVCDSARYETSFLPTLRAPVLYPPEGGAYFLLEGRLCCSEDLSSLRYQIVSDAGSGSVRDPGTGRLFSPRDARLLYWDGSVYYTDAARVFRYDLSTGGTSVHGTYTGGQGFLYGLSVSGSVPNATLSAEIRTSPTGPSLGILPLRPALSAASAHRLICPARVFPDVSPDKWYHEAVDYALETGMMKGVSDTSFSPGGTATRAMLVTILYRMEAGSRPGPAVFSDVAPGAWHADAVDWAADSGIVSGLSEGVFAPEQAISRQQLAAILYRYARYRGLDTGERADLSRYADADRIGSYAADALAWANAAGLITGRTETALAPAGTATRAETAAILMRFAERLETAA